MTEEEIRRIVESVLKSFAKDVGRKFKEQNDKIMQLMNEIKALKSQYTELERQHKALMEKLKHQSSIQNVTTATASGSVTDLDLDFDINLDLNLDDLDLDVPDVASTTVTSKEMEIKAPKANDSQKADATEVIVAKKAATSEVSEEPHPQEVEDETEKEKDALLKALKVIESI